MTLENLIPHSGNHSIQSVVLALEWAENTRPDFVESLKAVIRPIIESNSLREDPQRTVSFNIDAQSMAAPASSNEISGYVFSIPAPDGRLLKQIQINRTGCLFIVSDYVRWADLVSSVTPIFDCVLTHLGRDNDVSTVGLQYTDRFIWKGKNEELDLKKVFLVDSPYISAHSLSCLGLWHSHHGYFDHVTQPALGNRLDNINIALTDSPEGRAIDVLTSHRFVFDEPVKSENSSDVVFKALDTMHGLNKNIFIQLFTEELLIKVGLTARN